MTLIEKIENEIKELNKLKGRYYTKEYIKIQIETLNWVLSELKKRTCVNCKDHDICERYLNQRYGTCEVTSCSEWAEK